MRIVDIFYKNIEGTASDIKGNLHTIGHLMMLAVDVDLMTSIEGYFEINNHLVVNAKTNYPKLFKMLKANIGGIDHLANIEGDNIRLGKSPTYLISKAARTDRLVGKTFYLLEGGSVRSFASTMRLFIYHGVH